MSKYDKLLRQLTEMASGNNTKCRDFSDVLTDFGFDLRKGNSGGHKVATHPVIPLGPADAANFNCGHGQGATVGRSYVKKFLTIVKDNENVLKGYLK